MKQAEHTPTPWKYEAETERITGYAHEIVCWMHPGIRNPKHVENAAFIVDAVNNIESVREGRDRLKAALEAFLRFERGEQDDYDAISRAARAAIEASEAGR